MTRPSIVLHVGLLLLGVGCAAPAARPPVKFQPTTAPVQDPVVARAEAIRADPIAYLREVQERCATLGQYTLTFTRTERRGLLQVLHGPERIACWFRRDPFSVRMKWLDPDVKYGESAYVASRYDGKVRFVPRHGFLGLPRGIVTVDLQTPVTWGESRRPLTDFGLERLIARCLETWDARKMPATARYEGLKAAVAGGTLAHHIVIEYATAEQRVPRVELFIDPVTDLPAGAVLETAEGALDAEYYYADITPVNSLTDADFLMEFERAQPPAGPAAAAD